MARNRHPYRLDVKTAEGESLLRKSFAYCVALVEAETHYWLPDKAGVQAYPPRSGEASGDSLLLSFAGDGALSCRDTINNATGSADEHRVALRPRKALTSAECRAMQKVRNYGKASWADCVRLVTPQEMVAEFAR